MASNRSRRASSRPSFDWKDWREGAPALGLLAVVVGVLALTAILHVPDGGTDGGPVAPEASVALADGEEVAMPRTAGETDSLSEIAAPLPVAEPPVDPIASRSPADALEARAADDHARLSARRDGWTLQLGVLCNRENAAALLVLAGDHPEFHLLPKDHHGEACYRVCWGSYATREAALADDRIPPDLRAGFGTPRPTEISLVTP